ncbi:hypothetical protein D3C81_1923940 [compost metagenome]
MNKACDHLPESEDRRIGRHLLDFAFDPALRLVLNDHPGPFDDVAVQLGLARAVAAHGVQVHARFDHVRREDGRVRLVRRDRGDDIGTAHGFGDAVGDDYLEPWAARQVGH